jgi:hypothetical protein
MKVKTLIAGSVAVLAAVLLALVTSAAPHAASGGLVAAYGFDEGAGTADLKRARDVQSSLD